MIAPNTLIYKYSGLITGTLVRRYKRFLADVALAGGKTVTVFCPNTGSMLGLNQPGIPAAISPGTNPDRKTKYTLELLKPGGSWVAVNTHLTNRLMSDLIKKGALAGTPLKGFTVKKAEATIGKSRLDFLLEKDGLLVRDGRECYMEVKSVTLRQGRQARFPDAVTTRGAKHMAELVKIVKSGKMACVAFLVQRGDCECFAPAVEIDPYYSDSFATAVGLGVIPLVFSLGVTTRGIVYKGMLPLCV